MVSAVFIPPEGGGGAQIASMSTCFCFVFYIGLPHNNKKYHHFTTAQVMFGHLPLFPVADG
jgi:hypothetical protein